MHSLFFSQTPKHDVFGGGFAKGTWAGSHARMVSNVANGLAKAKLSRVSRGVALPPINVEPDRGSC